MAYGQRPSVLGARGGSRGTWKRVPPGHNVGIAVKADGGENVFSTSSHDLETMEHECIRLVPDVVNDVVTKFWRKHWVGGHHIG